jgi:inosose dehydratase
MRFGFEAYTWQVSPDSYVGRVDHIAGVVSECGGEGIELEVCMLGSYAEDPVKLERLLDSRGVSLAAICYVEDWLHDGETADEAARATWVTDYISRFPGSLLQLCPRSGRDRANLRERQQNAIRCLNDAAARAANKGVPCAVHPCSPAGSVFRTRDEYEALLTGLDSSVVGFVPDTGHILRGGMDPLETIRAYRPLVRHVHLRDASASGEWAGMGEGGVDFPAIVSHLAESGYEGWVIVDDESASSNSDPDGAARRNGAYVRDTLLPLAR